MPGNGKSFFGHLFYPAGKFILFICGKYSVRSRVFMLLPFVTQPEFYGGSGNPIFLARCAYWYVKLDVVEALFDFLL